MRFTLPLPPRGLLLLPWILPLASCTGTRQFPPPMPPLVKSCIVEDSAWQPLELRGSVASEGRLKLGFKTPGILSSLLVREGDVVRAGQVLAGLDGIDARTQLQSAKATLDRVRREAERAERLAAEGVLPANDRADARNRLEDAEAQWRLAQDGMSRTRLVAPATGTVYQRLAEPGEAMAAGSTVLILDTTERPVIRAGVTERELARLRTGQEAVLLPEDGTAPFKGRIRSLGAAPGASDGLYAIEVLPERLDLRPGTLLKVRIEGHGDPGTMRIPFPALVHRQDRDFVYVIEGRGPDCSVKARPVDVAKTDGRDVLLRQGLKASERIVAEGAFFLEDGQAVRILE